MPALCRDCLTEFDDGTRCPSCGRPRVVRHDELWTLGIAHMDCDAFFASVEKRDNPDLIDKKTAVGKILRQHADIVAEVARDFCIQQDRKELSDTDLWGGIEAAQGGCPLC